MKNTFFPILFLTYNRKWIIIYVWTNHLERSALPRCYILTYTNTKFSKVLVFNSFLYFCFFFFSLFLNTHQYGEEISSLACCFFFFLYTQTHSINKLIYMHIASIWWCEWTQNTNIHYTPPPLLLPLLPLLPSSFLCPILLVRINEYNIDKKKSNGFIRFSSY